MNGKPLSVWADSVELPRFEQLSTDIRTDALVIGGGLAGILCAYFLHRQNIDCVVVEAAAIGSGASKNTTAKITAQHGLIYHQLLARSGVEKAGMYLQANLWAVEKYRELCRDINCDFTEKSAFVYSLAGREKVEREIRALDRLGFAARFAAELPLPFAVDGALEFPCQAQFNPLKFLAALLPGLTIYERTPVQWISGNTAFAPGGKITARRIIVASHFPFLNRHGAYFVKMYQHRSYVLALANAPDLGGMYVDEAKNGLSFRNYRDLLLLGGGDHRTGKRGGDWRELRARAAEYYPAAEEKYAWAAQDCLTLDSAPYIGPYSRKTPGLLVATGFNKWGMTSSLVAARMLSDMICDRDNAWAEVFSPQRSMRKPALALNGLSAAAHLFAWSRRRCPHLGCALKWNSAEGTWDCPCHGSRFAADGALLDNPATLGLAFCRQPYKKRETRDK